MSFFQTIGKFFCTWTPKGRATRKEYWSVALFRFLLDLLLIWIVFIFIQKDYPSYLMGPLVVIIAVKWILLLPQLFLVIRRLHDTNKSGWFILVSWIPIVGFWILFYWLIKKGTPGSNDYDESESQVHELQLSQR